MIISKNKRCLEKIKIITVYSLLKSGSWNILWFSLASSMSLIWQPKKLLQLDLHYCNPLNPAVSGFLYPAAASSYVDQVPSSQVGRGEGSRSRSRAPCAACKQLRRRCSDDCIFIPYFPSTEPEKFAAVHRIFGESNASKLLQVLLSCVFLF